MRRLLPIVLLACLTSVASADLEFLDDVIIQFKLAVGFDAVDGEAFGNDVIRLKENNLRIHFQDTSNSASFPSNDWRLIANDTNNGGDNYFALEDSTAGRQVLRVDAGARANALYVDGSGRVGLGTDQPVADLHLSASNTPALLFEQDGRGGLTPQVWELRANESAFALRDSTGGAELVTVTPAGDMMVVGAIEALSFNTVSDRDAKRDIEPVDRGEVLRALRGLPLSTWRYRADPDGGLHLGPMAQDFAAAFGLGADVRRLAPSDLAGVAVAGVQALEQQLAEKDARIAALEARLAALEELVTTLAED